MFVNFQVIGLQDIHGNYTRTVVWFNKDAAKFC